MLKTELLTKRLAENAYPTREETINTIERFISEKTSKKKGGSEKKSKPTKGETYRVTLDLFTNGGWSVSEIAKQRGLAESTIQGHLAKLVSAGEIAPELVIPVEKLESICKTIKTIGDLSLSQIKNTISEDYSYFELQIARNYLNKKNNPS